MHEGERIQAHVVSVWRESRKLLSLGGREGMLLLTDRRLAFVHKTSAKINWWNAVTQRQVLGFLRSRDTMIRHDGYGERELAEDLGNPKNVDVPLHDILDVGSEDAAWGSVLHLEYEAGGRRERYRYSVAQDWVKYPVKEPTKYMKVDWRPFVRYVRERSGR
ncbi:MAG: hypothetical protein MPI95_04595 [Nitrosopumilus sp.]|nr:hypothetical protein [Nitrosopumilus sp.]CAI9830823.1 conserved hypothetical protein [Nitrosopumilaceae archaeon]MDA7941078.1 hypothetical protein [Nitrosopumilus sp.]MDA7942524.1 hypothetical protein [Nitrosopumilus sp.]MDA7944517.1 hypothetical protein [Nitrosopumilus sp.]